MLFTAFDFVNAIKGRGGRLTHSVAKVAQELLEEQPQESTELRKVPVDPREVKEAMDAKTDKFAGYEQRDAHEFLGDLIDYIHEELEEEQKQSSISGNDEDQRLPTDDFRMTVQKVLKCESCGYSRHVLAIARMHALDLELFSHTAASCL
jgi:ubiquitin C-terminal hydrolase